MVNKLDSINFGESPIILFDDMDSQVSYLMGNAESVSGEKVNLMTHLAKGLTYVCITEEHAKKLNLHMVGQEGHPTNTKKFTVSVDYKTNTTGISAFERSDTIKAFTQSEVRPEDFKRPGHTFPLISKENNMIEGIGIAEVSVFIAERKTNIPVAYVSEILNDQGEIANKNEVAELSESYGLPILTFSEVAKCQLEQTQWLRILDENYLDESQKILIYDVMNTYNQQTFKMYVRLGESSKVNTIFYRECQYELLDKDNCACKWHFRDYYKMLKNKEIDVIIFEQEHHHSNYVDFLMGGIITSQMEVLIEEIFKKHREEMEVGVSNY